MDAVEEVPYISHRLGALLATEEPNEEGCYANDDRNSQVSTEREAEARDVIQCPPHEHAGEKARQPQHQCYRETLYNQWLDLSGDSHSPRESG
jgi:hypothetical protein